MQTECILDLFGFVAVEGRPVEAAFDGGSITSDAGAMLLGATDRAIGLIHRFAACFHDARRPELIEHEVETLIGQRVFGLALGYEDLIDHDQLRHDPVMARRRAGRARSCIRADWGRTRQLRLWLSSFAYVLLCALRRIALKQTCSIASPLRRTCAASTRSSGIAALLDQTLKTEASSSNGRIFWSLASRIGERPIMTRKTTASGIGALGKRRHGSQQVDLFAIGRGAGAPGWPDLPKETREALVGLMTGLIFEHGQAAAVPTLVEVDHDRCEDRPASSGAQGDPLQSSAQTARAGRCSTPWGTG